jgi:SAM-dependent methyltransferase
MEKSSVAKSRSRLAFFLGIPSCNNRFQPEIFAMADPAISSVRSSYDTVAEEYARRIYGELEHKPFDCELLRRFAAATADRGPVCDMGCGPGHVARFLRDAGVDVFGLDLSPRMLAQARALNPGMRFREGNMLALDLPNCGLAGISAFYAIVNIPEASLPQAFGEMARVLEPGGRLLISFHAGNETLQPDNLWGLPIAMSFYLFSPAAIRRLIEAAGFLVEEVLEREPYAPEVEYQTRRAYIFARKPGAATSR